MTEMTSPQLQATALVDEWCKEYRRYLKDGSNSHAIHPTARDGLIAAVAAKLASEAKRPDLRRKPLPREGFVLTDNAGPMIAATAGLMSTEEAHAETIRLRESSVPDAAPAPVRKRRKALPAADE